jgi:hypothetical protein
MLCLLCYVMLGWVVYLFRCFMYLFHSLTHLVHLTNLTYYLIHLFVPYFVCLVAHSYDLVICIMWAG